MPQQLVVLLLFLHFLPPTTHGRWLFAPEPTTYQEGSLIPLKVNKLTSTHTGTPFPYYSLPFCTPKDTNFNPDRDVATILRGDHFEDSLYEIKALETIDCMVINYLPSVNDSDACTIYDEEKLEEFIHNVKLNYTVHWMLDMLPAAVPNLRTDYSTGTIKVEKQYFIGFPLGVAKDNGVWINNHVDINIVYRSAPNPEDGIVILGFEIAPRSQWYDPESWSDSEEGPKKLSTCPHTPYGLQSLVLNAEPGEEGSEKEKTKRIFWTYSVHWELNEQTAWQDRWAVYLRDASTAQMHVISIMNAIIIVLFLMVPVIAIVKRSVFDESAHHPGSSSRNSSSSSVTHAQEESAHHHTHTRAHGNAHDEDETRWKLLGVEALRAPAYPLVLSVLLGSGVHVICMMFVVIIFGMCGFMLPFEQGRFTIPLLVLFLIMGVLAGFWTMQSYKVFHGTHRIHTALATGIAFPALVFVLFLASVIPQHAAHSSAALPYFRFAEILMIWFGVSVPLVAVGNYLGFLKRTSDNRVHTNSLLRTVRKGVWYQRPLFSVLFSGVLPFGVVVIEYFFILNSLWDKPIYDSYRYLLVSIISLFITSASTNLVACFYQLNSGDHQWWWRPFLHGAASAAYMLIYSAVILLTSFKLKTSASFVLYFAFALFSSTVFFLLTSTVGFITCYFFVQTIYKHVHLLPVN